MWHTTAQHVSWCRCYYNPKYHTNCHDSQHRHCFDKLYYYHDASKFNLRPHEIVRKKTRKWSGMLIISIWTAVTCVLCRTKPHKWILKTSGICCFCLPRKRSMSLSVSIDSDSGGWRHLSQRSSWLWTQQTSPGSADFVQCIQGDFSREPCEANKKCFTQSGNSFCSTAKPNLFGEDDVTHPWWN